LSADDITDEIASLLPEVRQLPAEVRRVLADFTKARLFANAPQLEQSLREPLGQ
jgi:hypothetical protein